MLIVFEEKGWRGGEGGNLIERGLINFHPLKREGLLEKGCLIEDLR